MPSHMRDFIAAYWSDLALITMCMQYKALYNQSYQGWVHKLLKYQGVVIEIFKKVMREADGASQTSPFPFSQIYQPSVLSSTLASSWSTLLNVLPLSLSSSICYLNFPIFPNWLLPWQHPSHMTATYWRRGRSWPRSGKPCSSLAQDRS